LRNSQSDVVRSRRAACACTHLLPRSGMCCPVLFTDARNAYRLASDCPRESSTNS
jgi:hypothetical protein